MSTTETIYEKFGCKSVDQSNRRSKMETFGDIVRAIGSGNNKLNGIIMNANLSWVALQSYIKTLESRGLVTIDLDYESGNRIFRLSDRGFRLLHAFSEVRTALSISPTFE